VNIYWVSFAPYCHTYIDVVQVVLAKHGDDTEDDDASQGVRAANHSFSPEDSHGDSGEDGVERLWRVIRVEYCET
jgi:hypothetical protein